MSVSEHQDPVARLLAAGMNNAVSRIVTKEDNVPIVIDQMDRDQLVAALRAALEVHESPIDADRLYTYLRAYQGLSKFVISLRSQLERKGKLSHEQLLRLSARLGSPVTAKQERLLEARGIRYSWIACNADVSDVLNAYYVVNGLAR